MNVVETLKDFLRSKNAIAQPELLRLYQMEPPKKPAEEQKPPAKKTDRVKLLESVLSPTGSRKNHFPFGCQHNNVLAIIKALITPEEAATLDVKLSKENEEEEDAVKEGITLPEWSIVVPTDESGSDFVRRPAFALRPQDELYLFCPAFDEYNCIEGVDEYKSDFRPAKPKEIERAFKTITVEMLTNILANDEVPDDIKELVKMTMEGDFSRLEGEPKKRRKRRGTAED